MPRLLAALLVAAVFAALPATALADPPSNDDRGAAQEIGALPATVDGTTVDATREENEPFTCDSIGGSVWYRVTTTRVGQLIAEVTANGDMDGVIDVFRVVRSQVTPVACDVTDQQGRASVSVNVRDNQSYLVRVSRQEDSVADTFRLNLQFGRPPATPPGAALPPGGATGSLQRVVDPSVAYSVRLETGVTYRFNLASGSCTPLALFPPGTTSFLEDRPVETARCGGYMVYTPGPGQSGTYSLLATASTARAATRYRLMASRAGPDDIAPGRFIRNYARVQGSLDSSAIDVVDLYRFDVTRRSELQLGLQSEQGFRVILLSAGGKRIAAAEGDLTRRVKPGRYFAAVRAGRRKTGSYRLTRVSRAITRTRMLVDGKRSTVVSPGGSATLTAQVRPDVPGPVVLFVERFDPIDGWQFARTFRVRASGGRATVSFRPPSVGRWRVRAEFRGTRGASPSRSDFASFRVQGPLEE